MDKINIYNKKFAESMLYELEDDDDYYEETMSGFSDINNNTITRSNKRQASESKNIIKNMESASQNYMFRTVGMIPYKVEISIPKEHEDVVRSMLGENVYDYMDHYDELVFCKDKTITHEDYNQNCMGFYYEVVDGKADKRAFDAMADILKYFQRLRCQSPDNYIEGSRFDALIARLFVGPRQKSDEWYRYRVLRITASKVSSLLIDYKRDQFHSVMADILKDARKLCLFDSLPEPVINSYMQHGIDWEASARRCLADLMVGSRAVDIQSLTSEKSRRYGFSTDTPILECNIVGHEVYDWLAASPDGITHDGILIEIKCPSNEAKVSNPDPRVIASYEMQIMTQMECTGMKFAILYVFFPIYDNDDEMKEGMTSKPKNYKAFVKAFSYDRIKSINLIKALCMHAYYLKREIARFEDERRKVREAEEDIESHLMEE